MDLKEPFLFNPIKHHLPYILKFIEQHRHNITNNQVEQELLRIGGSQTDLYTGVFDINEIIIQIEKKLKQCRIFEETSYLIYLHAHNSHFSLEISDSSIWIMRWGTENSRFIHIHPGRYSKHTVRVKAITLKSFIAGALLTSRYSDINLSCINEGRRKFLDLPPVQRLKPDTGIGRLITLVNRIKERS